MKRYVKVMTVGLVSLTYLMLIGVCVYMAMELRGDSSVYFWMASLFAVIWTLMYLDHLKFIVLTYDRD